MAVNRAVHILPIALMLGVTLPLCLAGCGDPDPSAMLRDDGGDDLEFTIGGRLFHVGSAAARVVNNVLSLNFTDQPDACLAVTQVPAGASTIFTLRVAAQGDGTGRADVIAPQDFTAPGPGQAMGKLYWQTGGTITTSLDTVNGSVTWTMNAGGSIDVAKLDAGFTGAPERVGISALHLALCP